MSIRVNLRLLVLFLLVFISPILTSAYTYSDPCVGGDIYDGDDGIGFWYNSGATRCNWYDEVRSTVSLSKGTQYYDSVIAATPTLCDTFLKSASDWYVYYNSVHNVAETWTQSLLLYTHTGRNGDYSASYCGCYNGQWTAQGGSENCCGDDGASDDFPVFFGGNLVSDPSISCASCTDGAYIASQSLCGNGFFSSSNSGCSASTKTVATSGYCYTGDITCDYNLRNNGAVSSLLFGNGYPSASVTLATTLTCYYGDIICADGSSANGASANHCGNGYFSSSNSACTPVDKSVVTSGYCYMGNIVCGDGTHANGAVSGILYGNGYWTGSSLTTDTSGTCYYGDILCADSFSGAGSSSVLYGNGYIDSMTCYYGDISCADGSRSSGASCELDSYDICGNGIACSSCAPYNQTGDFTACYANCAANDDAKCMPNYHCYSVDNVCYSNANGNFCDSNSDCTSGICDISEQRCISCDGEIDLIAGTADASCGAPSLCDEVAINGQDNQGGQLQCEWDGNDVYLEAEADFGAVATCDEKPENGISNCNNEISDVCDWYGANNNQVQILPGVAAHLCGAPLACDALGNGVLSACAGEVTYTCDWQGASSNDVVVTNPVSNSSCGAPSLCHQVVQDGQDSGAGELQCEWNYTGVDDAVDVYLEAESDYSAPSLCDELTEDTLSACYSYYQYTCDWQGGSSNDVVNISPSCSFLCGSPSICDGQIGFYLSDGTGWCYGTQGCSNVCTSYIRDADNSGLVSGTSSDTCGDCSSASDGQKCDSDFDGAWDGVCSRDDSGSWFCDSNSVALESSDYYISCSESSVSESASCELNIGNNGFTPDGICVSGSCCNTFIDANGDNLVNDGADCYCSETHDRKLCDSDLDGTWDSYCNYADEWTCSPYYNHKGTVYNCSSSVPSVVVTSIVDNSIVDCANVSNSTLYYVTIKDASINITDANITLANIVGSTLVTGEFSYGGYTYQGPFNINDIYNGIPPSGYGTLSLSKSLVASTDSLYVIFNSGRLGYSVSLDLTSIGNSSTVNLVDDGTGNDVIADDGIYTGPNISINSLSAGNYDVVAHVDDGVRNQWSLSVSFTVDTTPPSVTFYVSDSDEHKDSASTNSRLVNLMVISDEISSLSCKFANTYAELSSATAGACSRANPWILSYNNGVKTVYYEIYDALGNTISGSDSILLDMPVISAPEVQDSGVYWGYADSIEFAIVPSVDDPGLTYDFRIYNATGCSDFSETSNACNITNWIFVENPDVIYSGLTLLPGINYTIGARVYSGGISSQGMSDGFMLDLTPPTINDVVSSALNNSWISQTYVSFIFNASDSESGIRGYSYYASSVDVNPDTFIDTYSDNVLISGLKDGKYYINVKAASTAKLFSDVYKFVINVDSTRPPAPRLGSNYYDLDGYLMLNWTSVTDISGIDHYEVLISSDSQFKNILFNVSINDTVYSFGDVTSSRIYVKVRAVNGVGLYSVYSDEADLVSDSTGPNFKAVSPVGLVNSLRTILHVETDEDADCWYKGSGDSNFTAFDYTGSKVHDQALRLEDGKVYTYLVDCVDAYGNSNSTTALFEVAVNNIPTSIELADSSISSYTSSFTSMFVTVKSGSRGLSGLASSGFKIEVDGKSVSDFSSVDKGNGVYSISFKTPDLPGERFLKISYGSVSSGLVAFDIFDLYLEVSYSLGGDYPIYDFSKISYSEVGNYAIGVASESDNVLFNSSEDENRISVTDKIGVDDIILFVAPSNSSYYNSANKRLVAGDFLSGNRPSFSSSNYDKYAVSVGLSYPNFVFFGDGYVSPGDANIIILNHGLTANNKINISVVIE